MVHEQESQENALILVRVHFTQGDVRVNAFKGFDSPEKSAMKKLNFNDSTLNSLPDNQIYEAVKRQVARALREHFKGEKTIVSVIVAGAPEADKPKLEQEIDNVVNQALGIKEAHRQEEIQGFARYTHPAAGVEKAAQRLIEKRNQHGPVHQRVEKHVEFKDTVGDTALMDLNAKELAQLAATRFTGKGTKGVM